MRINTDKKNKSAKIHRIRVIRVLSMIIGMEFAIICNTGQ
jgi:hypothetical protein